MVATYTLWFEQDFFLNSNKPLQLIRTSTKSSHCTAASGYQSNPDRYVWNVNQQTTVKHHINLIPIAESRFIVAPQAWTWIHQHADGV